MAKKQLTTHTVSRNASTQRENLPSVQKRRNSPTLPIVHSSNERYYLDECEGGGYIVIDWDELDPPEGSPGAIEIPQAEVFARIYERYGYPPGATRK